MARERYLLDETEDTIHRGQIKPETGKEKRENWWFYHKVHVIVGVIAAAFVAMVIYSFASRVTPDYVISLMTGYAMPSDLTADIQTHLERFGDDRNGDGKVVMEVRSYQFSTSQGSEYDAGMLQASFVKFAADASSAESIIFMYDDASYDYLSNNDMEGFFAPFDGTDNPYYLWQDVPGLEDFKLQKYAGEGVSEENVKKVLSSLKVAVRAEDGTAFKDDKKVAYRADCIAFMERLFANTPVQ